MPKTKQTPAAFAALLLFVLTTQWDALAVNLILPSIGEDLGGTATQWVISAAMFATVAINLLAGRLGDKHGLGKLVITGYLGFAAASAACAMAPNLQALIAARIGQGLTGAMVMTGALALLATTYPLERKARAIAMAFGLGGIATVAAPILGGILAEASTWREVFWLEVPLSLLGAAIASRSINAAQEAKPTKAKSIHTNRGLLLVIAAGSLGNAATVLVLFAVPWRLQEYGIDTGTAGALLSIAAAALAAGIAIAHRLTKHGVRPAIAAALATAGIALLASTNSNLPTFVVAIATAAFALGVVNSLTIIEAMTTVSPERAGEAAGLTKTAITVAAAIALALASDHALTTAAVISLAATIPLAIRPRVTTKR